jgi:hypothetical protein
LESLESQKLRRDNVFENAGETQWCRAHRGKAKVEAFGIWKIFQSLGRKRMLNRRSTTVVGSAEKIWTVDSCPGSVGRVQWKNRSEPSDLGTWTDSHRICGKLHEV